MSNITINPVKLTKKINKNSKKQKNLRKNLFKPKNILPIALTALAVAGIASVTLAQTKGKRVDMDGIIKNQEKLVQTPVLNKDNKVIEYITNGAKVYNVENTQHWLSKEFDFISDGKTENILDILNYDKSGLLTSEYLITATEKADKITSIKGGNLKHPFIFNSNGFEMFFDADSKQKYYSSIIENLKENAVQLKDLKLEQADKFANAIFEFLNNII